MNEIEKSILKTLAYFDIFDYPLNKDEIWNYLFVETRFIASQDVSGSNNMAPGMNLEPTLGELVKLGKVNQKDSFYFLLDRGEIVEARKNRYEISLKKIKKARRVVWWLRFIPWIKAIFICSGLGLLNAEENADIDLLIITQKNRIWSARWWSAGILKILNLRPKNENTKDKFCLGHFITEDSLSLENTKIQEDDIHLIYLLSYYLPLYSENNLWQRFVDANNWIKEYLPNFSYNKEDIFAQSQVVKTQQYGSRYEPGANMGRFVIKPCCVKLKKLVCKLQFDWEEGLYKKIQLKIMPEILKQMMNKDNRVIVNDKMIKLHSNDSREEVHEKWLNKISKL